VYLVGFTIEIYHDARPYKRQICQYVLIVQLPPCVLLEFIKLVSSERLLIRKFYFSYNACDFKDCITAMLKLSSITSKILNFNHISLNTLHCIPLTLQPAVGFKELLLFLPLTLQPAVGFKELLLFLPLTLQPAVGFKELLFFLPFTLQPAVGFKELHLLFSSVGATARCGL